MAKTFNIKRETVAWSGGSFEVRGISALDISLLFREHREAVSNLFDEYIEADDDGVKKLKDEQGLMMEIATKAPEVMVLLIALAADDKENTVEYGQIPLDVQIDALDKIGRLTFSQEGGPKKVVEIVVRALQNATGLMTTLRG